METLVNTLVTSAVSAICYWSVSGAVNNKVQGNEKQKLAIEKLTRFTGSWEESLKDGVLQEAWLPPKSKTGTDVVRFTRNEGTEFVEMIKN